VNVGVHHPYIRVIGIEVNMQGPGRSSNTPLAPHEEEEFRHLASSPNIYDMLARSIAPSIFGSMDIKKAIACLLIGGSRKRQVSLPKTFLI
jgi:DNA replication licensing factor MCM5